MLIENKGRFKITKIVDPLTLYFIVENLKLCM